MTGGTDIKGKGIRVGIYFAAIVAFLFCGWYVLSLRISNGELVAEVAALRAENDDLSARLKANFFSDNEVFSASGKLKDIGNGVLFVETEITPELPPLPREPWPTAVLEINFTDETEFVILDYTYDEEGVPMPQEEKASLEDLHIGDNVTVTASDDIKRALRFTAVKVTKEEFMDRNEGEGDEE